MARFVGVTVGTGHIRVVKLVPLPSETSNVESPSNVEVLGSSKRCDNVSSANSDL